MQHWEPGYAQRFDRVTTVSEADRKLLHPGKSALRVDVIPNGVDTELFQPLPHLICSPALLFIGNLSYAPCVDAVLYFCREILPLIRRAIGAVDLWVVGRTPTPEVMQLNGDGLHVTGSVDDVVPYYARSAVSVVPLRAGGGTRLKILESMALGRPVVSTSIGSEGLDVVDGEHLLTGDSPEQFAEKTIRLLLDRTLYEKIVANGRQLVVNHYAWDEIAKRLMRLYEELVERCDNSQMAESFPIGVSPYSPIIK